MWSLTSADPDLTDYCVTFVNMLIQLNLAVPGSHLSLSFRSFPRSPLSSVLLSSFFLLSTSFCAPPDCSTPWGNAFCDILQHEPLWTCHLIFQELAGHELASSWFDCKLLYNFDREEEEKKEVPHANSQPLGYQVTIVVVKRKQTWNLEQQSLSEDSFATVNTNHNGIGDQTPPPSVTSVITTSSTTNSDKEQKQKAEWSCRFSMICLLRSDERKLPVFWKARILFHKSCLCWSVWCCSSEEVIKDV